MRKIVLAGGSGQVGNLLRRHFAALGDKVIVMTRNPASGDGFIQWDGRTLGDWTRELEGADLVVNLCGRSVNCRYHSRNRQTILVSRIDTTRILGEAIERTEEAPRVWMNASTATIYRYALDRDMDEQTGELGGDELDVPETWRFSMDVARRWEEAFAKALTPGTRKIALRSAMTMSPDRGGVFDTLLGLVRKGLGGQQGSGRQFVSWIHEADFAAAIECLLADVRFEGPINLAAPNPLPNCEFMADLRKAYGISFGLPSSRWMLELAALVLGTETELVLKSRRVVPGKLLQGGFRFEFPEWSEAARNLVLHWKGQQNNG
jgi:uncharacterized protein (TIGR01777 family)